MRIGKNRPREAALLSEIYLLRLEAAKRAANNASRVANTRYVPLTPSIVPERAETAFEFKQAALATETRAAVAVAGAEKLPMGARRFWKSATHRQNHTGRETNSR